MDRRKPFYKANSRTPKTYRKIFIEKNEVRQKSDELMAQYHIPEGTALEIALGITPFSAWEKEKEKEQNLQKKWDEIEQNIKKFSNQASLGLDTAVQILKGSFGLKEYREQKISKMELQSRAENFAQKENIPIHIAKMILLGKFSLIDYQKRQEEHFQRQKKAEQIRRENSNITIGACYKIIDEGLTVEEYLIRREQNLEKRKEWYRNYLQQHQQENQPLAEYLQRLRNRRVLMFFSFFHHKTMLGTIIGHTPYEIRIRDSENKSIVCRKIDMKYLCRVNYVEQALSMIEVNKNLQENPIVPSLNPNERYQIPSDLLQEGKKIKVTLYEGETFIGIIQWYSKYDIKLSLSETPKSTVLIFRHSINDVQPV